VAGTWEGRHGVILPLDLGDRGGSLHSGARCPYPTLSSVNLGDRAPCSLGEFPIAIFENGSRLIRPLTSTSPHPNPNHKPFPNPHLNLNATLTPTLPRLSQVYPRLYCSLFQRLYNPNLATRPLPWAQRMAWAADIVRAQGGAHRDPWSHTDNLTRVSVIFF